MSSVSFKAFHCVYKVILALKTRVSGVHIL